MGLSISRVVDIPINKAVSMQIDIIIGFSRLSL